MADTFAKKELQKKRAKKKLDKAEKKEERKSTNNKGKTLEEMTVYLDEWGNFTDVPPEKQNRTKVDASSISLLPGKTIEVDIEYTGVVSSFFTDKAYGFISEDKTRANIFVHSNQLMEAINQNDKVIFEKERTPKGFAAVNVRKIK